MGTTAMVNWCELIRSMVNAWPLNSSFIMFLVEVLIAPNLAARAFPADFT